MIELIFNKYYINDCEIIFYSYLAVIVLIILLTSIFVIKEVKKNVDK